MNSKKTASEQSGRSLSRRDFLKGSAIVGGVAAVGALSGCGADPVVEEETPDIASSTASTGTLKPGQYSFEIPPDPIAEDQITETVEAEVIVIGAGGSGTFAALAAAEEGAQVIVLQKSAATKTNGIGFSVFGAQVQLDAGQEFDLNEWIQHYDRSSYGYGDHKYIEAIVCNSGKAADMINRLAAKRGESFGSVHAGGGMTICMWLSEEVTIPYSFTPTMIRKMSTLAEEDLNVQYYWNTPARYLEKDGNRVVAVIAEGPNGYIRAKASKGIILATGDIGNNPDMIAKYAPFCQGLPNTYQPPENTGDGHAMALWAGNKMYTGPFSQGIHYDPSPLPEGDAPFSGNPYLAVNIRGERYQNEDLDYPMIANANVQQPEHLRWHVIDNTFTQYWNDFQPGMCRDAGFMFSSNEEALEFCLGNGGIKEAQSLEEAADNIGLTGQARETFFKTVERYNELCDKGMDEDFGKNPEYLVKTAVRNPPFYTIKREAAPLQFTDGGYCNEKMQAIDENFDVIPGLYLVGNTAHGMFAPDYPLNPGGSAAGRALTSGYIAGKVITDSLPDYKAYYAELAPTGNGTKLSPGTGAGR